MRIPEELEVPPVHRRVLLVASDESYRHLCTRGASHSDKAIDLAKLAWPVLGHSAEWLRDRERHRLTAC